MLASPTDRTNPANGAVVARREHPMMGERHGLQGPPELILPLEGFSVRLLKSASGQAANVGLYEFRCDRPQSTVVNLPFGYLDLALSSRFEGAKAQYVGQESHKLCPVGSLVFSAPDTPFRFEWGLGVQRSIFCRFDADFRCTAGSSSRSIMAGLDIRDPVLRHLLVRLARELTVPDFGSSIMIETLWIQIQLQLLRFFRVREPNDERPSGQLTVRQLRTIEDWIDSAKAPFTISDLSSELGISNRHLARLFNASTGSTITRYAVERQVAKAKTMLTAGKPVKVVSWTCGFETASAFSTAFKKAVGMSPRDYARDSKVPQGRFRRQTGS
jgi:AraC family transcriptional regulator